MLPQVQLGSQGDQRFLSVNATFNNRIPFPPFPSFEILKWIIYCRNGSVEFSWIINKKEEIVCNLASTLGIGHQSFPDNLYLEPCDTSKGHKVMPMDLHKLITRKSTPKKGGNYRHSARHIEVNGKIGCRKLQSSDPKNLNHPEILPIPPFK